MNRVYKVIWSKAKHCYVVTSEIARSVTKSASSARSAGRKGAAVLAMAALLFTAGGMLGEAANVTDVTAGETANVITVTKEGSSPASITINNVAHAKEADSATEATKAYSDGDGLVIKNTYVKIADAKVGDEVTYVNAANTVGQNLSALDTQVKANADAVAAEATARKAADQNNLKVGDDGVISKVTGDDGTTSSPVNKLVLKVDGDNQITMDEKGIKVGTNSTVIASDGVFAGGDTADAAKAALNADGSIKGANGKFTVGTDGKVTANGVDTNGGGIQTHGGGINAGSGDISGKDITASGNISGNAISGTTITGTSLSTKGGAISGGAITGTSLNTQGGDINGGDITSSGAIHANGKITGTGLDAGSGAINGKSLSVTGAIEGNSLKLNGGNLDAGSGTITTTGDIKGNNINATGKITTKDLEVTDGLKTDHMTLGDEPLNQTDINKGNVTSKIHETSGGVEYTAESVFNKDGSSITARTDEGATVDSTGISKVGANGISQYLGNNAEPKSSDKNVTRNMVRNDDGTFSMEDKVVDGAKSSIVNQTETGIKSTATDGKNTASTNLSNGGFNTYATDGTNKTYTKQTATDIKNTAEKGMISNTAKNLVNTASENMTNNVGKNLETTVGGEMKTTVTGKVTEDFKSDLTTTIGGNKSEEVKGTSAETVTDKKTETYNGGLETTVTGEEKHTVNGNQNITVNGTKSETVTGDVTEDYKANLSTTVGVNQTITVTGDSSLSANNITNTATEKLSNSAAEIENTASTSITDKVGGNTTWKMTDGKISESIVNGTASNKENTTVDGTKRIITSAEGTGTYNQTATSNNISMKNAAGDTSFTKSESLDGEKTSVTNPDGSSTINQSAGSIVNFVKNKDGNTTRTEQSATDITNSAKSGTITNDAKNLVNTASEKITSQIGNGSKVKSEMTADGITNTAEGGTIYNKSKDILNEASGDILNFADGEIGNVATKITNITGDNTVTSDTKGTTFVNTGANTPVADGNEQGSRTNTKIKGNTVETGKVMTDFADVNNNLTVGGSTTLGRNGNTNLTVNSKSEFKDTVKMEKTLEVDGESTFNNKVTITKGGLDVKGGTTTDTLEVKGTSEFGGKAAFKDDVSMDKKLTVKGAAEFKDDVSMGKNLTVTGKTETGTLHVNGNGYVDGDLNVKGNIETHDAELSENSRQVVTGRQLYQTNERVDRLDNRIKKVGANAAALAALRPGDFNPDDKFSIAAGFGSYRNASAAALGLFYRPNENVLLSLGTSFGDGENMVNAGVSVKFGRGKSMAERRKEMAEEVSVMRDEMKNQNDRIAELEEMLKKQSELIEKLSKES